MTVSTRPRGRRRDPAADARLTAATLEVLRRRGPEGVTIEAVAEAAGLAKTTVYRRHRNAGELLTAALATLTYSPADLAHLEPREATVALLDGFRHGLEAGIGLRAFITLISQPDSEFSTTLRERLLQPRLDIIAAHLEDAQRLGLVDPALDAKTAVLMMAGSYFTNLAVNGHAPQDWAERAVALIWHGMSTETASTGTSEATRPGTVQKAR